MSSLGEHREQRQRGLLRVGVRPQSRALGFGSDSPLAQRSAADQGLRAALCLARVGGHLGSTAVQRVPRRSARNHSDAPNLVRT